MKILVVSNMYPSVEYPNYGVFVKNFISMCEENNINVEKVVLTKKLSVFKKIINYILYYINIFIKVLFKEYDYVYVHYAGQNSIPIYILTNLKKFNLILNVHGSDIIPEKGIHQYLLAFTKRLLNRCNKVVVPSEYYKNLVSSKFNVDLNMIFIFPSAGIDPSIFYRTSKDKACKKTNITQFKKIIGYVSRIDYGKGWDTLLEAIKILDDNKKINTNEYQFVFVGIGSELKEFNSTLKVYNLEKYIVHHSFVEQKELFQFYNSFDVLCFPTRRESESLGLVALEALACGVPVITSDFAAPAFYIKDGINGLKFKVKSSSDLASKIEYYFNLPDEIIQGMKGKSIESSIKYYRENIKDILKNDILNEIS